MIVRAAQKRRRQAEKRDLIFGQNFVPVSKKLRVARHAERKRSGLRAKILTRINAGCSGERCEMLNFIQRELVI